MNPSPEDLKEIIAAGIGGRDQHEQSLIDHLNHAVNGECLPCSLILFATMVSIREALKAQPKACSADPAGLACHLAQYGMHVLLEKMIKQGDIDADQSESGSCER